MKKKKPVSQASVLGAYKKYLVGTAGLTNGTCELYAWHVSKFLSAKYGSRAVDLGSLKPTYFIRYIQKLSGRYKPSSRRIVVTALRNFLRWLEMNGICAPGLSKAAPTISCPKLSGLPESLSKTQLSDFLYSFDRSRPNGLRGYAVALCMARLGLRIGEVAQLTLDDIDWRAGTLRIAGGKSRHANILPLTQEVGEAIVDYLRNARPRTRRRHLFVCHRLHKGRPASRTTLRNEIYRAYKRSGLEMPSRATHVLRHTAATQLIQKGATLKEIADVLGHKSIDTTAIYTKVDYPTLRTVAMPWPEVRL